MVDCCPWSLSLTLLNFGQPPLLLKLLYPKQAALPALVYNIWRSLKFSIGPANKSIWNNFELILEPDVAPMSLSHVDFTGEEVCGLGWTQQMGRIQKS